jgi:rhodanese-related sulfurtransferase
MLQEMGFEDVGALKGGMAAWAAAGFPVASGQ